LGIGGFLSINLPGKIKKIFILRLTFKVNCCNLFFNKTNIVNYEGKSRLTEIVKESQWLVRIGNISLPKISPSNILYTGEIT